MISGWTQLARKEISLIAGNVRTLVRKSTPHIRRLAPALQTAFGLALGPSEKA